MRTRAHLHPCAVCGAPTDCHGEREPNPDGWPRVICPEFHVAGGVTNPACLCDACAERIVDARAQPEPVA